MAKRKAVTKGAAAPERDSAKAGKSVEPMVIALAEQLGTLLGRAQKKADAWMDDEALREQLTQIRDGAADLLKQVNKSAAAVRLAAPKRQGREGGNASGSRPAVKKSKAAASPSKGRSGGVVDAPGKRHRKPPPQELFDPRLGEPMGKQMGQKSLKRRGRG